MWGHEIYSSQLNKLSWNVFDIQKINANENSISLSVMMINGAFITIEKSYIQHYGNVPHIFFIVFTENYPPSKFVII